MRYLSLLCILAGLAVVSCTSSSGNSFLDASIDSGLDSGLPDDSGSGGDGNNAECFSGEHECDTTGHHKICSGSHWTDDPCPAPTTCTTSFPQCACPDAGTTQITGTVYAPNGLDPVSKAFVFLASDPSKIPKEAAGAHCTKCLDPRLVSKSTLTDAEGKFTLTGFAEGQQQIVVVRKGPFQRVFTLTPQQCSDNAIPSDSIRLPADPNEAGENGRFPSIAVSTGMFDQMEEVIGNLGINLDYVDIFNGGGLPAHANKGNASEELFAGFDPNTGEDNIMKYDIVFINCGQSGGSWDTIAQTRKDLFARYVNNGGRLYVTDMAYDFVEQVFPDRVVFLGDTGTSAGTIDAAEKGNELPKVTGQVVDDDLRAWLETNFPNQISGGNVDVVGWLQNWAVVDGFDPSPQAVDAGVYRDKDLWVQGEVTYSGTVKKTKPLTLSFNIDPPGTADLKPAERTSCGRVLFSSYHTYMGPEQSDAGVDAGSGGDLIIQERILEYLILEIGVTFCDNIIIG